jgi:hypothetical protein
MTLILTETNDDIFLNFNYYIIIHGIIFLNFFFPQLNSVLYY